MNSTAYEELDRQIDALMADPLAEPAGGSEEVQGMLLLAADLRYLPERGFKVRLKADLLEQTPGRTEPGSSNGQPKFRQLTPPSFRLLIMERATYPMRRTSLGVSLMLHAAALALVASSGLWLAQQHHAPTERVTASVIELSQYALPPAADQSGGGGGGGDQSKLPASYGAPPRFARDQFTPPTVTLRTPEPVLPMQPTVVGPPEIRLPEDARGDPMSVLAMPSSGIGVSGGIGSGTGGGVGRGRGPGVGAGRGGGIGGGVYRVGGGVSAPRLVHNPDPQYSDEARRARYQGTVVLWAIIGPDGKPHELRVQRSLGMGLDEKAVEAVRNWRFEPAMKDGTPVSVQVNIEVNFRLY